MKTIKTLWLISFFVFALGNISVIAQEGRNVGAYNQAAIKQAGLYGYDPVSYFAEGGSNPVKGIASITHTHGGITYRFSSVENREIFKVMPERYEPTYGHYCAWAMAQGGKVDIDPTIFTIDGNRLHFFIARRAKRNFDRNIPLFSGMADNNWRNFSGEEPRL